MTAYICWAFSAASCVSRWLNCMSRRSAKGHGPIDAAVVDDLGMLAADAAVAVLLCRSVPLLFLPCRVIQPKAPAQAWGQGDSERRLWKCSAGQTSGRLHAAPAHGLPLTVHASKVGVSQHSCDP